VGTNAVNGVINIITKAQKTQKDYLLSSNGKQSSGMEALRYGGKITDNITYRVYGTGLKWVILSTQWTHCKRSMDYGPGRFSFDWDASEKTR